MAIHVDGAPAVFLFAKSGLRNGLAPVFRDFRPDGARHEIHKIGVGRLSPGVEHRLHRVKVAEEVGDQPKDIVRDARPVRELRDDERAADLGKEHVSFAKFIPAGDYFDQCQHRIISACPS
jgi:hypothetical protein